jgi:hypothetical protein
MNGEKADHQKQLLETEQGPSRALRLPDLKMAAAKSMFAEKLSACVKPAATNWKCQYYSYQFKST